MLTGPVLLLPGHALALVPVTEASYRQAVLQPFLEGLNLLKSVAETLQNSSNLDEDLPNIRCDLKYAYRSLSAAEQVSLEQVRLLSANAKELLNTLKSMRNEQAALQARQQGLQQQLLGLRSQAELSRQQLAGAQRAVDTATEGLWRAEQQRRDAEQARSRSFFFLFIPFAGPFLAISAVNAANTAIRNANNQANAAKRSLQAQLNAVNMYQQQCKARSQSINAMEESITANKGKIQAILGDITRENALQQQVTNFLIPVRQCSTFLSTMAGRSRVANMLVQFSGMLDALLPAMDDIVKAARPLAGGDRNFQLLITVRLPTIVEKLEQANRKVKDVATARSGAPQENPVAAPCSLYQLPLI
ncbi:hypothetical protein NDU88_000504 [Pleurodeles waltl]|uniref:Uncharacterized protein n=1 Tax=Pleurodeles waltl TaxID=8319 RepID=A0AAV7WJ78_PLEWA|nr:hypothetical protein NDU88_000504 [Pleurodeles waltl]